MPIHCCNFAAAEKLCVASKARLFWRTPRGMARPRGEVQTSKGFPLSTDNRVALSALAAVLVTATVTATAQTATSGTASGGALEEIVVTAQKREQNSQDIGISLSAITGSDLASMGATTATDITKSMPAV